MCRFSLNWCDLCVFPLHYSLFISFSPGMANDPAPSAGPMKRRTQSLSALPKDGDRKVSWLSEKKIKISVDKLRDLLQKYISYPLLEPSPSGRKTTSAVQWMRSWSSANAIVLWCTNATPTRTIGLSARSWGSGGTPWVPTRSSSTTTWPSRWAAFSLLLTVSSTSAKKKGCLEWW